MKVIILAGGFAKRMWPLTKTTPKQLLPINNIPMLQYTLNKIVDINGLDTIYITTNQKFEDPFKISKNMVSILTWRTYILQFYITNYKLILQLMIYQHLLLNREQITKYWQS